MQDLVDLLAKVVAINLDQAGADDNNEDDPQTPSTSFCSTCHQIEDYITIFDSVLAKGMDLPVQYAKATTAQLGRRSEFEERAQVQKCVGCKSILQALDHYFEHGDENSSKRAHITPGMDYDIQLNVEPEHRDLAWAKPLRITALGLPV